MPALDELDKLVPNLPGYRRQSQERYHKTHFLDFKDGVRVVGNSSLFLDQKQSKLSDISIKSSPLVEGEALRFYGYYLDKSGSGDYQNITIHIFHDNSIQVYEKATENSGHFQGVILKRVQVPGLSWTSFNVGQPVTIHGRTFDIASCDLFTRETLERHNIHVPKDVKVPVSSPTASSQQAVQVRIVSKLSSIDKPPQKSAKNFLNMDGKVLRFYCVFDDHLNYGGYLHNLVLHYFLADDTIEVREYRDNLHNTVPYMRRQKMPKRVPDLPVDGSSLGDMLDDIYKEHDLSVGKSVKIYNRVFYLCGCDEYTRSFYHEKFGTEMPSDVELGSICGYDAETGAVKLKQELSVNSENDEQNDSSVSVPSIIPSGSDPIVKKFGYSENDFIACVSKLVTADALDMERVFQIRLYLVDDTIAIFEKGVMNSGIKSGKFLERRRVKKPNGRGFYGPKDFLPGAILEIYGRKFSIEYLDECAKAAALNLS